MSTYSTYNPKMPLALTDSRVFDETWSDDKTGLMKPNNLKDILDSISSQYGDNSNKDQHLSEYKDWLTATLKPTFSEDMAGHWFDSDREKCDVGRSTRLSSPRLEAEARFC